MSGKDYGRETSRRKVVFEDDSDSSPLDIGRESNESDIRNTATRRVDITTSDSPVARKDVKEVADKGKAQSEPALKHEQKAGVSDNSLVYRDLTYAQFRSPDKSDMEVEKDSSGDGTLNGKLIEFQEEIHICDDACQCVSQCQSLSDVDPLPLHYSADQDRRNDDQAQYAVQHPDHSNVSCASPPINIDKMKKHAEKIKNNNPPILKEEESQDYICECKENADGSYSLTETSGCVSSEPLKHERSYTNRYNYNHVKIVRGKDTSVAPFRKLCEHLFTKKKRYKEKNMKEYMSRTYLSSKDSGETIPQLYKAKLRQISGAPPQRFTFQAYPLGMDPGCYEKILPSAVCHCTKHTNPYPHEYSALDLQKKKPHHTKLKKSHKAVSRRIKDLSAPRACLNFEGNEYVSTRGLPERIDIYCFDHLNTSYFRTSDEPPPLITDAAMERTEAIATRFWAELFGFIHIFIAFIVAFILQFYKFVLYSLIRPIMIGVVQLTSDYFFKPLLTIVYNGFTQPLLVFCFNVAASLRDVCSPIARGIGYFISEFAVLLRAIRIVDLSKSHSQPPMKDSNC